MDALRIGALARLASVNVQTIRYYERQGLLPKPNRRLSGYREYPPEAVGLVRFIKHIQALGFSLKEIKAIIALASGRSFTVRDAARLLERKLQEVDAKLAELRTLRRALAQMVTSHRHGDAEPFAPAFHAYIQHLSAESVAGDHRTAGNRGSKPAKKNTRTLELYTTVPAENLPERSTYPLTESRTSTGENVREQALLPSRGHRMLDRIRRCQVD